MDVTVFRKKEPAPPCSVRVPSSKSLTHRALIAAALADGTSQIFSPARGDDILATIRCLRALGAKTEDLGDRITVTGPMDHTADSVLDCGESASTLRFLIPVCAAGGAPVRFTGSGRLLERPLEVYRGIFGQERFSITGGILTVRGPLPEGRITVRGDESSQNISGLMFALPLLSGDHVIDIIPPLLSSPYVDMTAEVLKAAGIETARDSLMIRVPGGQRYRPFEYTVPPDWSSAAPFIVLSLITGQDITIENADRGSLQADAAILGFAERFSENGEPSAIEADISDCPDLGPLLFAAASLAEGTTVIRGIKKLRTKESDRVLAMKTALEKLGVSVRIEEDAAYVTGSKVLLGGAVLDGFSDHRIVMALAVLACAAEEPVTITGAEAVSKSWPNFFSMLETIPSVITSFSV